MVSYIGGRTVESRYTLVSYERRAASICGGPDCTDRPVTPKPPGPVGAAVPARQHARDLSLAGAPWPCYPQVPLALLAHESSETLVEVASVPPHRSLLLIGRYESPLVTRAHSDHKLTAAAGKSQNPGGRRTITHVLCRWHARRITVPARIATTPPGPTAGNIT